MKDVIRQKIVDSLAMAPPPLTRRQVHVPRVPGKALAVIGPRRAGKTTFLWQLLADQLADKTSRENLLYFNFEDERLAGMTAQDIGLVAEEYYRLHPEIRDQQRAVFYLDEIQVVPGWEKFTRRLLDTEKVDLVLSGSSAQLLSREIATSMRGRAMEALVLPFSFREFLRHRQAEPSSTLDRLTKAKRSAIDKELRQYLIDGGYPETQGVDLRDRFELLRSYTDTALLRDVIERHKVSNPVALRWMMRQLLGNACGLFSIHKFHSDLRSQGIPVAKDTLHAYLLHLEDAFLIRTLAIATDSERRRMVNPRKVYPIDPGLIAIFDRSGKANAGHALETVVALELLRRGAEIAYVRTARDLEVDFLARYPDGTQALLQVCMDLDQPETINRETRALLAAAEENPQASLHLVTATPETPQNWPPNITLHAAATWLLNDYKTE
ncbi:ATP-binding protein [Planctomycetota bacterium]